MADIFVFPSLYEGFGVALLEALGAGKACVASRTGPIPEIIEDGKSGILIEPQSSRAIADAVIRLAGDRLLREQIGIAAKHRAETMFSIEQSVRSLEDLYEGICSRNERNPR